VCSSIDRALSWLVERHGPVASIAARDLLFVALVHRGDDGGGVAEAKDLVFFMLVAACARWGHHDPWQSLVLLKMVTDDQSPQSLEGIELELKFGDFVKPGKLVRAPLSQQSSGPPLMFTNDEFAMHLASVMESNSDIGFDSMHVSFAKLCFRDLSLKRVVTTVEDTTFERLQVRCEDVAGAGAARGRGGRGRGGPARGRARGGPNLYIIYIDIEI
jgi:hypothetical protein